MEEELIIGVAGETRVRWSVHQAKAEALLGVGFAEQLRKGGNEWESTQIETNLFRNLSKVVDESNDSVFLEWIFNRVNVNVALVEEVVEDVDGLHGRWTLLLISEHQVNPLMQMRTDVVTLKSLQYGVQRPKRDQQECLPRDGP